MDAQIIPLELSGDVDDVDPVCRPFDTREPPA